MVRARVSEDLAARLDAEMERDGRSESDVVRRALDEYLAAREGGVDRDRVEVTHAVLTPVDPAGRHVVEVRSAPAAGKRSYSPDPRGGRRA